MRIAGIEDGSFNAFSRDLSSSTFLCCVLMDHYMIDDIRLSVIEVDGLDATEKLLGMLDGLDTDAIILGGITFGGFNIVDPFSIMRSIETPVIIYSGKIPDSSSMLLALMKHFKDWRRRWAIIDRLGTVHRTVSKQREPPIYFEVVGASAAWADEVIRSSAMVSRIPEPVRVAGLVARGVS